VIPRFATPDVTVHWRHLERQPLVLELHFSYRSGGISYVGTGRTRNFSGEMISFDVDQTTLKKGEMELRILWPTRLQDVCPLELVVKGRLVRTEATGAVLKMQSCEFRTLGPRSFNQVDSRGVTCDLAA
jgi:hypothetical protein